VGDVGAGGGGGNYDMMNSLDGIPMSRATPALAGGAGEAACSVHGNPSEYRAKGKIS